MSSSREILKVDDRERWNEALGDLPCGHVLQSYEWGAFKNRHGWIPFRLLFMGAEQALGGASVLLRRLPGFPWGVMYVPKGPALDYDDKELVDSVLGALERLARQRRAMFIKIDPDVPTDRSEVRKALLDRGWRASQEQVQFRNTFLIDLRQPEDDLLMAMKSKTRYNTRLAKRRSVKVRLGGVEDLSLFHRMYTATSVRDDFVIRPYSYYTDVWESFVRGGLAQLFLAHYEGETLAGLILFHFGDRAWYMYGASTNEHRNLMPNHLLQWEAMKWAKAHGYTFYDMWGAPDVLDDSDPMWGVYRFKAGFGGDLRSHLGAYDFPASRPLYRLYTVVVPRYLELLRRRHWGRRRRSMVGDTVGYE
jgi:peptidoglycan pentaglycine glycine transferase (the first glycine)